MHAPRLAVIDMGTNTFHLLVADVEQAAFRPVAEYKQAVRLGQGGISAGILTEEAQGRALDCLRYFLEKAGDFGLAPSDVHAFATSAVRSAKNGPDFTRRVFAELGLRVSTIGGAEEAGYIFDGVRATGAFAEETAPVLVMDIGGGSVEFILGKPNGQVLWLQSFEVGGQRLVDAYMKKDPIAPTDAKRLISDMKRTLAPLAEACTEYKPQLLIGASGTFDTLRQLEFPNEDSSAALLPWKILTPDFVQTQTERLRKLDRTQRLAIPGISELRADMIVVALLLLQSALEVSGIRRLCQSSWALKEGVAFRLAGKEKT